MKWFGLKLALLMIGFVVLPVSSSNSFEKPLSEATFVVG